VQKPSQKIGHITLVKQAQSLGLQQNSLREITKLDHSLISKLEYIIRQYSDNIALEENKESFTYNDIDLKSKIIVAQLRQLGLSIGDRIGVYLPESLEKVFIYLGLLRAGIRIVVIPILETSVNVAKLIKYSKIKHLISLEDDHKLNMDLNYIHINTLLSLKNKVDLLRLEDDYPAYNGTYNDIVLEELVWTTNGKLTELKYTHADIFFWLQEKEFTIHRKNVISQAMWWHLLQGKTYKIKKIFPSYLNSVKQRVYHISDLGINIQRFNHTNKISTSVYEDSLVSNDLLPAFLDGGELSYPPGTPETVVQMILNVGKEIKNGLITITEKGEESFFDYKQVVDAAKRVTKGLQESGLHVRSAVILQCENLIDHFISFWGCILGGYIPVSVAIPPLYIKENAVVQKLVNVCNLLDNPAVICNDTNSEALFNLSTINILPEIKILEVEKLKTHNMSEDIYSAKSEDIAFYQLSSGSTGIPKCIQITHQGIISHCEAAKQFNAYQQDEKWLNWLPLDHVGSMLMWHLQSVYLGATFIQLSTNLVLSKPLEWIRYLSKYKVAHTWSPNFGYKIVVDALKKNGKHDHYDLSSIKSFLNGGEQVQKETIKLFFEQLSQFGLKIEEIQTAFGMAETCTAITYHKNFMMTNKSVSGGEDIVTKKDEYKLKDLTKFISTGFVIPGATCKFKPNNQLILNYAKLRD